MVNRTPRKGSSVLPVLLGAGCAFILGLGSDQPGLRAQPRPDSGGSGRERCAALSGRTLGGATVDSAEYLARGDAAGATFMGAVKARVPLCRVRAHVSPVPDSRTRVEIWLPEGWNGKLFGIGGGGLNGGLDNSTREFAAGVALGYAGIINDAGHPMSQSARWAYGHPQKLADFGSRGDHVAAVAGKAVVNAYYGRPARRSYYQGCSGGGREALTLAQRHPEDYDGIVAGAPAADFTALMASAVWNSLWSRRIPDSAGLPAKLRLLRDGAVRRCDRLDGVADGVIASPLACRFDPAELQCEPGADPAACLGAGEVAVARALYAGLRTRSGAAILPGVSPGSEEGWEPIITVNGVGGTVLGAEFFRWIVHQDPDWTNDAFRLDSDFAAARSRVGPSLDATDPDLRRFARRGGKLLIYHGWEDPIIPAKATLAYYEAVRRRADPNVARNVRLFMLPGVSHCGGGHGPGDFDRLDEIDRWVEQGAAPERIIVRRYQNDGRDSEGPSGKLLQSRPVCAWPKSARYAGRGSTDDAANFRCEASRRARA